MTRGRWLLAAVALAWSASDLVGQVPVVGGGFTRGDVGFTRSRRGLTVSGFVSGGSWGYYQPYPFFGVPPARVSVYYFAPPVVVNPSPIVVAPVQQVFVGGRGDGDGVFLGDGDDPERFDLFLPRQRKQPAANKLQLDPPEREPAMPGDPASVFRPVRPAERNPQKPAVPVEPPRPPARNPAPVPPRRQPPPPPPAPLSLADQGRQAFADQEYGRAERLFRQATLNDPGVGRNYFLLAQALFALAKYREAVEAVHAGMRLEPDWPDARFPPRELYGPNEATFDDHLRRLEEAAGRFPADPVLPFLLGYELWFDGQQERARAHFRRARPLAPDKTFIDRFLGGAAPGGVVARR